MNMIMKIDNKNDVYKYTPDEIYDYICELHNKIDKAIEYMKSRFMNCIDNDKRYFADDYIQEIYEILKESDVDE